jgi:hypothetical protein
VSTDNIVKRKDKLGLGYIYKRKDIRFRTKISLKVVTNEKGEAFGELLTIRPYWGSWCWMFFCHFNGLPSCMKSY